MYLSDQMNVIVSRLKTSKLDIVQLESMRWMMGVFEDVLNNAELYSFERSALSAAGNLRLGTPDRTDALFRSVLKEPGRYFIESSFKERQEEMLSLMTRPDEIPEGRYAPLRIGIDIQVLGQGKAVIKPIWNFDKTYESKFKNVHFADRAEREALQIQSRISASFAELIIDMSEAEEISFEEFREKYRFEELPKGLDQVVQHIHRGFKISESEYWRTAWSEYRLASYTSYRMSSGSKFAMLEASLFSGKSIDDVHDSALKDLNGETIIAIALLAVLQARKNSDAIDVIERKATNPTRSKRPKSTDLGRPSISIVRLNNRVAKKGVSDGNLGRKPSDVAATGEDKVKRRLHVVSGHLFLARNGKVVWRREHFRGELKKPVLKIVK